ncbi:MAG: DMP19 family protein [Bacteroidaceae bacterium]|nr:DMP19 family protein [Bacteroidaceae bacterium]
MLKIKEQQVIEAAQQGIDAFVELFYNEIMASIDGELNAESMQRLTPDQITLVAYYIYREEVMDGGHVQLIHNGYGPFIFLNPFAKAMRLWGAKEFSKLVYSGRKFFEENQKALTQDCSDEEFMAIYENYPEADDLDDEFIIMEEEVTDIVAHYIDDNLANFAQIEA